MKRACAVLYYRLWLVWQYHTWPHYFMDGTIWGKNLLNMN